MNLKTQYFIAYIITFLAEFFNPSNYTFNIHAIPLFITGIFILYLGILVFIKRRGTTVGIRFLWFCLSVAVWLSATGMGYLSKIPHTAKWWFKFDNFGVMFISINVYSFTTAFIGVKRRRLISIGYMLACLFTIMELSTNYLVTGVRKFFWGYFPSWGPLSYPFFIFFFGYMIISFIEYLLAYRTEKSSIKKNQIKYMAIALLIAYTGSVDYLPTFGIGIYPSGYISLFLFITILTYSIMKHKLLDINIVFRKTLIYSLIIGFLFTVSVVILFTSVQLLGGLLPQRTFWLTLFLVIILSLLFQPVYRKSTSVIDKLFFKGTLPQIAEELQHAEKLAALGVIASGLAHEIKNPLAPIKTYIQNLASNANDPKYIDKISKIIPTEIDKITDIINQLRDFANPAELSITKLNIHNLIDKRINLLEHDFASRKILVERKYSPQISEINVDPIQLERVFLNLFLNAIEAMPHGGKLTISTEDSILIKVSDTGIGIDKESLPHIFDPFYSKGKHKGMGLGLAIIYRIIKEHNGSISVESQPGRGTTFSIYLNES